MYMHAMATHGLSRSPMREAFQKTPLKPVRCASRSVGARSFTYVHVQMNNNTVVMKDLKSKSADICPARERAFRRVNRSVEK